MPVFFCCLAPESGAPVTSRNLLDGILKFSLMLFRFSSGDPEGDLDTVTDGPRGEEDMADAADLLGLDIAIDG